MTTTKASKGEGKWKEGRETNLVELYDGRECVSIDSTEGKVLKLRKTKTHLAETSPLTEELGVGDLDQVDLVLGAESLDELDVLALSAGLVENAEMSLALVEGLGSLAETAGKTVVDEGVLENVLESVLRGRKRRDQYRRTGEKEMVHRSRLRLR